MNPWAALLWIALVPLQDTDFKSRAREFEKGMRGGNPRLERERAIKLCSEHRGLEPTKLLVKMLNESVGEHRLLDQRFQDLTQELGDILDGSTDVRLAPAKRKEQLEQRRNLGKKIAEEAELTDLIVDRLGTRRNDDSIEFLAGLPNKPKDWRIRVRLIESLGLLGRPESLKQLHKSLADKDPRVRMYAAESVGAIGSEDSVLLLGRLLEDKEWQVRAYALDALKKTASRWAVPHLIPALGRETGRLREEISELLGELTGQELGVDAGPWVRWWEETKAAFLAEDAPAIRARDAKNKTDPFSYYGIKTYSDKVCFILDISDSMNDDAEETELPDNGIPNRTGNLRPKIQVARDHLAQAIVDLPEDATFNIIVYNKYVKAWKPKLVKASRRNKNDALAFVLEMKATESTNIFEALELALQLAGPSLTDRYYASPLDTIFFLTDGKATEGRLQEPVDILAEVKRMNKVGKITIHSIGVGYLHDKQFLRTLAEQNGGTYVNVQ